MRTDSSLFFSSSFFWGGGCRGDKVAFKNDLVNIARTTLSSKVLSLDKDYFANLSVDAVLRLKVSLWAHVFLSLRAHTTPGHFFPLFLKGFNRSRAYSNY